VIEIKRPQLDLFSSFMEFSEEMRAHGETLWDGYYPKDENIKDGAQVARPSLRNQVRRF
jgi:hypothetical protein